MSAEVRRGTVLSFSASDWTAMVYLDGADAEAQIPVGQWVPSAMMAVDSEVAVLVFGGTNTDDALVLGPYGVVNLWARISISAIAVAPTGNMRITGLPFTSGSKVQGGVNFWLMSQLKLAVGNLGTAGSISNSTTVISLNEFFTNAASVAYPAAN